MFCKVKSDPMQVGANRIGNMGSRECIRVKKLDVLYNTKKLYISTV